MKITLQNLLLFLCLTGSVIEAKGNGGTVHVKGYTRKDGTYVQPHNRTAPDGNFNNNWSTQGNVNPYTGEDGTKTEPSSSLNSLSPSPDARSSATVRTNTTTQSFGVTSESEPEITTDNYGFYKRHLEYYHGVLSDQNSNALAKESARNVIRQYEASVKLYELESADPPTTNKEDAGSKSKLADKDFLKECSDQFKINTWVPVACRDDEMCRKIGTHGFENETWLPAACAQTRSLQSITPEK